MKIILDTETTGLDPYSNQIAQLSYLIIDNDNNIQAAKNYYFAVDEVDPGASKIHGLTVDKLDELSDGKTFKDYSEEIYKDLTDADEIICHNTGFDISFITWEFKMLRIDLNLHNTFCTMEYYTDILKTPNYYGYKWPKLEEVVRYLNIDISSIEANARELFNMENSIGYHDSRVDILYTYEIFKRIDEINE